MSLGSCQNIAREIWHHLHNARAGGCPLMSKMVAREQRTIASFFGKNNSSASEPKGVNTTTLKRKEIPEIASEKKSREAIRKKIFVSSGGRTQVVHHQLEDPVDEKCHAKGESATEGTDGYYDDLSSQMHESWIPVIGRQFKLPYFRQLQKFLNAEHKKRATIYPPKEDIFSCFESCTLDKLKVVIIGQDPYHGPGQAHGMAFSVRKGIPIPPSLKNMYKEAISDVSIKPPTHGFLKSWSDQGVLLLNTVLTVRRSEANSHRKRGWETFTSAVIKEINDQKSGVVFLLWGRPAQEKAASVDRTKHHILTSSHPSPLGATKTNQPFIGSRCFSKTNEILVKAGKAPIDWNVR